MGRSWRGLTGSWGSSGQPSMRSMKRETGGSRMLKPEDIKVKVEFTPGYETRFTEACLRQLAKRERQQQGLDPPAASKGKMESA